MNQMTNIDFAQLAADIINLYALGAITDLSPLALKQPTREQMLEVLHRAGFSDQQIADRDYR